MAEPSEFGPLSHAVLTSSFTPEGLPEKVAAAGVVATAPEGSPSLLEFSGWGAEPSTTPGAVAVGRLTSSAYQGLIQPEVVAPVARSYGDQGVVGAVGIAAAARMFDQVRDRPPGLATNEVSRPAATDETRPTLIRIRKSFDHVPPPWEVMSWQPRSLSRWWGLHEAVMAPGLLTGDEKGLGMVAVATVLGMPGLAAAHSALLPGWSDEEIEDALAFESPRLRRGVRTALVSIGAFAVGALESERFELAAASMPAVRARELRNIVDLAVGLATFAQLKKTEARS
jgi:hypothetical protein